MLRYEPVAQLVEHLTFNQMVVGSIPPRLTIYVGVVVCGDISRRVLEVLSPYRLAWPRTSPFHGDDRGSNPLGDAKHEKSPFTQVGGLFFLAGWLWVGLRGWFGVASSVTGKLEFWNSGKLVFRKAGR